MAVPALEAVLSGRAGPEGVREAVRAAPVRPAVRRAAASLLLPGVELGPVRLDRVKLKPGRKLSVWGRATAIDGEGRRCEVPLAVTWVPPSDFAPPSGGTGLPEPPDPTPVLRSCHAVDEATGMELLASPWDPTAPELAALLAPGAVPDRPRATTIRYRPRQRHVVRYDAAGSGEDPRYAKLVPGRDGAVAAAAAVALADGLDGSGDAATVRPVGVLPGGAVLYPRAPGRPLPALLRPGRAWPEAALRRCGAALRRVHDLRPGPAAAGHVITVEHELAGVARAGEHLAALDPDAARLLDTVLGAAAVALAGRATEVAPGHGDCKLDHFWLDRRTVTFIDVDSAAVTDPARDLGKLLADLRWWAARKGIRGLAAARAAVAAGYDAPGRPPERWTRAAAWEGLLVAKAALRRTSLLDVAWSARTCAALREAGAVLGTSPSTWTPVAAPV